MCCCKLLCFWKCIHHVGLKEFIGRKLIFFPPRRSYKVEKTGEEEFFRTRDRRIKVQCNPNFLVRSVSVSRNTKVFTLFVKCPSSQYCFVYFHGNAIDLGQCLGSIANLSMTLNVSVFAYDFRGYGLSEGKSTINNFYNDAEIVMNDFVTHYNIDPRNIILYGHSLGTVLATHLGSKTFGPDEKSVLGVVLISAFSSALKMIDKDIETPNEIDVFSNEDKIQEVFSPILIIHGVRDGIVPVFHSDILAEKAPNLYEKWLLVEADHNDISVRHSSAFYSKLHCFIEYLKSTVTTE